MLGKCVRYFSIENEGLSRLHIEIGDKGVLL